MGHPVPDRFIDSLLVDAIHDGSVLPEEFRFTAEGEPIFKDETYPTDFVNERDWGAELVASHLSAALGIGHYYRVTTARSLMDFGRFPGITPPGADHLHRYAINYPFSRKLSHQQKHKLLTTHYDRISSDLERALKGKRIKIAVHTYDKRNPTQFERPAVSLLTRPFDFQHLTANPFSYFDPCFPSKVIEYTADRLLRTRIAQTLEEASVHTADNFPYSLPDGSVEVRAQVWYFFQHVRACYTASLPPRPISLAQEKCPREMVWEMLLDTNLRSTESQALRGYIHMFRTPPESQRQLFQAAREEYELIRRFITKEYEFLVNEYRESSRRPSTLLIEVRKDLVWNFSNGYPVGPRTDNARFIARKLALAISQYLKEDRPSKDRSSINRSFL